MNLYDKSSLILVPSGVKASKVYSQRPENGSGDFTFSRSTAATRVGPSGYIEKQTQNLLLQSNQFDTTWINVNTTETSGHSGYDGSSNAWLLTKTAANGRIYQNVSTSGVQTFSLYAKANDSNWISLWTNVGTSYFDLANGTKGSTTASTTIGSEMESVGNGWYRCSLIFNTSILNIRIYPADGDLDTSGTSGSIYIQDAQLEEGLVARDYIETTTSAVYGGITDNIPRLDYSGGASCPSLLLEPQRTNIFDSSEYLTTIDPDLTQSVSDIISPISNVKYLKILKNNSGVARIVKTSSAGVYTYSVFAKQGSNGGNTIQFADSYFGFGSLDVSFDLSIGAFNGTPSGNGLIDYGFEDFGNGSYRVWTSFNHNPTTSVNTEVRSPAIFLDDNQLGVNEYIYLLGFQFENGSYPTSYIPTFGTFTTRNGDVCNNAGNASTFNSEEGVLYAEIAALTDGDINRNLTITDGSYDNYVVLRLANQVARIQGFLKSGGGTTYSLSILGQDQTDNNKIALVYKASEFSMWLNGSKVSTASPTAMPIGLNTLGFDFVSGGNFYGKLRNVQVFNEALTDAELQKLTT